MMRAYYCKPWIVSLALSLLVSAEAARADDVDALYEQGEAAFDVGKFEEARAKFAAVWAERKSYDVAAVLSQAELKVGRNTEAAEHLAYAVAHFPISASMEMRKKIESAFAEVRGKVGTVKVEVSPSSATLSVNGRIYRENDRATAIFVDAGEVTVEVRATGYMLAKRNAKVEKGGEVSLVVVLEKEPTRNEGNVGPRNEVLIAGGGGALLLAGVGLGLSVAGSEKGNGALVLSEAILKASRSCVSGASNFDVRCGAVKSEAAAADAMNRAGIGLLIGGGALAAGTALYWLFAPRTAAKDVVMIAPIVSWNGGGAIVRRSF